MHDRVNRILLAVLAAPSVLIGLWAGFAPRSFYDDFPGGGRSWVAPDGPYNEHLVRDVGVLNLALAVVTIAALVWLTVPLIRATAAAWLVYGIPHFVYHARHTSPFDTSDDVSILASLAIAPILAIALFVLTSKSREEVMRD